MGNLTEYEIAEARMAKVMKRNMNFFNAHMLHIEKDGEMQYDWVPPESMEEYKMMEKEVLALGEELACIPHLFDIMVPWMVEIRGSQTPFCGEVPENVVASAIKPGGIGNLLHSMSGISKELQLYIEQEGFKITDRGGGCSGWHIGVPCNEVDSRRLCTLLHMHFKRYVDSKQIRIVKRFWKWHLPTLYNVDAVERYYKEKGELLEL